MSITVLSGLAGSLLAAPLQRTAPRRAGWLLALLPLGLFIYFLTLLGPVSAGRTLVETLPWAPGLGVEFSFYLDGLGLLMALLVSGIGALVLVYAGGYLEGHPQLGRMYAFLLVFMSAMLGVVLSGHLLTTFLFWELTSISSFLLIGFDHKDETSRKSALQALLVTGGGGLAMLAGLVLLNQAAGTLSIPALLASSPDLLKHPLAGPAAALILLGAFTKSAQFPFHFWLPNAMAAPTPVSAYLHSATMVKAGVFLILRLGPVLGDHPLWTPLVSLTGAVTLLLGAWMALSQTDLKRLLAYSTVSMLGLLTLLGGLRTPLALEAAVVFLFAHALYKGALFMVAGAVDHETGTRDVTRLGGLARRMPQTAAAALPAGLSMAALPPLFGFIAKEVVYEAALESGLFAFAAVFAASAVTVFAAAVIAVEVFWARPAGSPPREPHEAPLALRLGPLVLAGLGLLAGLLPGPLDRALLSPAAAGLVGHPLQPGLALWHGLTPLLAYSALTFAAGALLYLARRPLRRLAAALTAGFGPDRLYDLAYAGVFRLAAWQTGLLQHGTLRYYLNLTVLAATGLVGTVLLLYGGLNMPAAFPGATFYEVLIAALILLAAGFAITTRSRLGAVAALGMVGYGVAAIFLLFGAPDLAMTQFLIESLTVILFVLAFYHLPDFERFSSRRTRLRDMLVAMLAGVLMTVLTLSAVGIQIFPTISSYYAQAALPEAHGRNITNVILVDFRGFDTLGENVVLALAAIGVFALLKFPKRRQP